MRVELACDFGFEAAHFLPSFPEDHKCRRLHGHSFRVRIVVAGQVPEERGYLVDYADIDEAMRPLLDRLDHHLLNEIEGLENPTSEVLARWLWRQLEPALPGLAEVEVRETCTSRCRYRGG